MPTFLRLYEDILSGGADDMRLPALPRMIFIVHGSATIGGQSFADGEAFAGEGAATLTPGQQGVTAEQLTRRLLEVVPPPRITAVTGGPGLGATSTGEPKQIAA